MYVTVWKFQDFTPSQILREIIFVESRSSKIAVLLFYLGTLDFVNFVNFSVQKLQKFLKIQIQRL